MTSTETNTETLTIIINVDNKYYIYEDQVLVIRPGYKSEVKGSFHFGLMSLNEEVDEGEKVEQIDEETKSDEDKPEPTDSFIQQKLSPSNEPPFPSEYSKVKIYFSFATITSGDPTFDIYYAQSDLEWQAIQSELVSVFKSIENERYGLVVKRTEVSE